MKQILLIWFFVVASLSSAFAQNNEVSLIVTGEGVTKQEATNNALRSAIEQAFGVFVSANTEILNDELVKDEIATVSSGNVKSFKEISSVELPSGIRSVTLDAIVSIGKLIEYSKNHGSKAEFAGAVFGANIKLRELRKQNELKAILHQIEVMSDNYAELFNASIEIVGSPFISTVKTFPYCKENVVWRWTTFNNLAKDRDEVGYWYPGFITPYNDVDETELYNLRLKVKYDATEVGSSLFYNLMSLLSQLSISQTEREEYDSEHLPYYSLCFPVLNSRYYLRDLDSIMALSNISAVLVEALYKTWDLVLNFDGGTQYSLSLWSYNWNHDFCDINGPDNVDRINIDILSLPTSPKLEYYLRQYSFSNNGHVDRQQLYVDGNTGKLTWGTIGKQYEKDEQTIRSILFFKYNINNESESEVWDDNAFYLFSDFLEGRLFCINEVSPNEESPIRSNQKRGPGIALFGGRNVYLCRIGGRFPVEFGFSSPYSLLSKTIDSIMSGNINCVYDMEFYFPISQDMLVKIKDVEIKPRE